MVLCKTDSAIVCSLGARGGVKLILLISGQIGVLEKCTCFASLYISSVVTAAPCFLFTVGGK